LIGDFNLPDVDWFEGTSSAVIEAADEAMLEQIVDFPTHIKGNCLDLILTNMPERFYKVTEAGRLGKSDHEMILSSIVMDAEDVETEKTTINWKKADWSQMCKNMSEIKWSEEFEGKTAQEMWMLFRSKVEKTVTENVPERRQQTGR
jgi:hypothetical protein